MEFLLGGFYLFLINTALIALSTWVVVRYLGSQSCHVEPAVERRYKRLSALFFLALLGPCLDLRGHRCGKPRRR